MEDCTENYELRCKSNYCVCRNKCYFFFRYGLVFGPIFEYGCDHQITKNSRLAATMVVGAVTGVTLKLK